MKLLRITVSLLLVLIQLFSTNGIGRFTPHLAVIPDIITVGLNYIKLETFDDAPGKKDLRPLLSAEIPHPFLYANKECFDLVRKEYNGTGASDYTKTLMEYVLENAKTLTDKNQFPPIAYALDEEDSILPISRETINRMIVLGYAWQITGEEIYAARAWEELENVCAYPNWCTWHFLASAEMAAAVSIGYDWLYDYLKEEQKDLLAETTYKFAILPALSGNKLKNWFTWSKNNWNSICYSGIGLACMAFGDRYPEETAAFLAMCYRNMPIAYKNFTPDGVYAEGPGYCQSGMDSIVRFIASSRNYFGTDFGIADIDGFRQLGYFPVYITTPAGVFNFGDNKARRCYTPSLHWYASAYQAPLLAAYQMSKPAQTYSHDASDQTESNGDGKDHALSSLWYNREYTGDPAEFTNEPLMLSLHSDVGQDLVLMRSAYLYPDAYFAGIKAGYNFINHGDLDIGSFVYDANGVRWAEELGPGAYDMPNYFLNTPAGDRWKNYCKRAEGQNTLVINPGYTLDDQYALAICKFTSFNEDVSGAACTLDMTNAYRMNGATNATRTVSLNTDTGVCKISDTVSCIIKSDIYWFMHTAAEIVIAEDGKTALLKKDGKQLRATLSGDGTFSVMEPETLKPGYVYEEAHPELRKLTVHLDNIKKTNIEVTLTPLN